jgi:hypothetical protein
MRLRSEHLFLACSVIATLASSRSFTQQDSWPVVQPLHITRTFANAGKDTPFVALIKDTAGLPIYKFECHNGNYENDSKINFSGDSQCALFAFNGSSVTSGNLLVANDRNEQSTDWWNRGRMHSAQLRGECLAYPEYSTDRHFNLRGMLITLRFTDMEWSAPNSERRSPALRKFTFVLDVTPDKAAHSPSAVLPPGPVPPRSCYP